MTQRWIERQGHTKSKIQTSNKVIGWSLWASVIGSIILALSTSSDHIRPHTSSIGERFWENTETHYPHSPKITQEIKVVLLEE